MKMLRTGATKPILVDYPFDWYAGGKKGLSLVLK
jgi:hypothetical protein